MANTKSILKGLFIALVVVATGAALYLIGQGPSGTQFSASVVGPQSSGTPGDGFSPLESSVPCTVSGTNRLEVTSGPGSYDWYSSPSSIPVLQALGSNSVETQLLASGPAVDFIAPSQVDFPNLPSTFIIEVGPEGFVQGTGTEFTVKLAPSCVERLDFVSPAPNSPLTPVNGQVQIGGIRATLTNGVVYEYDQSQLGNLELDFLLNGTTPVSSTINIPIDHGTITIDMQASGDNIAPTIVPQFQQLPDTGTNNEFTLASSGVNPNSLVVFSDSANTPDQLLDQNSDYRFVNSSNPNFADVIELIDTGDYPAGSIHIQYEHHDPISPPVSASRPLTLAATSCDELQSSLVEGSGQGFATDSPLTEIDPIMNQGETKVIFSQGGVNQLEWRTSDPDVVGVAALADERDINEDDILGNENVLFSATIQQSELEIGNISASTTSCSTEEDPDTGDQEIISCDVSVVVPVTFEYNALGYPVTIVPPIGNPIAGTVQGTGTISGTVTGNATLSAGGGVVTAEGTLTGSVSGDAIGGIDANITVEVDINAIQQAGTLSASVLSSSGNLSKSETLIPTVRTVETPGAVITNFAVLTALRPGTATIFASDGLGCTAPIEIDVRGQELTIDFANTADANLIEVGDTIQLVATTDFEDLDPADPDTVTNETQWISDNTDVAIVDSVTGRVTAVAPGVANIYAEYSTGITETGALRSNSIAIQVDELEGLTLSLNEETLSRLTPDERTEAFVSAVIIINDPAAEGFTVNLEGVTFTLDAVTPGPGDTDLDAVESIVDNLNTAISTSTIADQVSRILQPSTPGVLVLVPTASNGNGAIDISTTATARDVSILPSIANGLTVSTTGSYGLTVVGNYLSGLTREMNIRDVTFVSDPVNRLNDSALAAGRLELGDEPGRSTVFVETTLSGNRTVRSNQITVNVPEGPTVDFARVIGAGSITKGSRIDLQVRVSDAVEIASLQDLEVALVRSNQSSYDAINSDPNATFFQVTTFEEQVAVTESSNPSEVTDGSAPAVTTPETPANFRVYRIPIEIPVDTNLFDGNYKLLISISDASGNTASTAQEIFIGERANGDVNGDGRINMLDVILAFRIANGSLASPTQAQLEAADLNGAGGITLVDVLILFRQVTSS